MPGGSVSVGDTCDGSVAAGVAVISRIDDDDALADLPAVGNPTIGGVTIVGDAVWFCI